MEITSGHLFYISGLLITLLISLFFFLSDKSEFIFSEKLIDQKIQRIGVAIIGFIILVIGIVDLFLNWDKVDVFGRLFN